MAKTCTAHGCEIKTQRGLPFCKGCLMTLHRDIRHDLIQAYKVGGLKAIALADQARDLFLKRKDNVSDSEQNEMIEVTAELKQERELSFMVWDGRMKEFNGQQQEDCVFLPKKLCNQVDATTFEVPYWLAKQNGLI